MNAFLEPPAPARAAGVAVATTLVAGLGIYATFLETDYGWTLFSTYEEIQATAARHEAAGNLREAERLIRHIAAMEEKRFTRDFGLFALFAGPGYLAEAQLKLAQLAWHQDRSAEADARYREALRAILEAFGPDSWRHAVGRVEYAEFLLGAGRYADGHSELAEAEAVIRRTAHRRDEGGPIWGEDEYAGRESRMRELGRRIAELRLRFPA